MSAIEEAVDALMDAGDAYEHCFCASSDGKTPPTCMHWLAVEHASEVLIAETERSKAGVVVS